MKLHRLALTNYRGVADRAIEFPDSGVVVVCGANEVGKSSMIEALDLLLESKDRSTKKEVKQVKPTNADVGSEVTAEISTGLYRFIYRKRFHKRTETQLTVLAPRREQLTGDEAHERVSAIFAETVDTDLWRALRVLQAASTAALELSGCEALSRALDVAAGATAGLSGSEPLLVERIDTEYARYFTATGRPTAEWATAAARLREAEEDVTRWSAAVDEVEDRVRRHEALTHELAELYRQRVALGDRHTAAQTAAARVAELAEQLREAQLIAAAAAATNAASSAAHDERLRLRAEFGTRAATLSTLEAEAREAAGMQAAAQQAVAAAEAALDAATTGLATAQQRVNSLRSIAAQVAEREEAERLAARLTKIDAAQHDHDRVCAELSAIGVTEAVARRVEAAASALERIDGQLALVAGTLEITAAADIDLVAAGQQLALATGQSWSTAASGPTEVEVSGVLTARFSPGVTTCDIQAKYAAAQQDLVAALAAGSVADLAAARGADLRRRALEGTRDQLTATLAGLCGDDEVNQVRLRLSRLRAGQPAVTDEVSRITVREDLEAAETAHAQAATQCEACRQVASTAAAKLAETVTRTAVFRDKLVSQRAELDAVADRLNQQRAVLTDAKLAAAADAHSRAAHSAEEQVAALSAQLDRAAPDTVAAELADAASAAEALRIRTDGTQRDLHQVTVELAVFGTEGRHGELDAAKVRHEHAAVQYSTLRRRARAAELLRSVVIRHRDTTRLRYVEPFRAELQRLARLVFGESFEVDIDNDLRICSRTLHGCTVPYDSLSGGAKEQLGILARLAAAALVAKEDAVPVLIDDALGFTDSDRLAKMSAVFDLVGAHGQLIVLTCTPARYERVHGAHRIDLSA